MNSENNKRQRGIVRAVDGCLKAVTDWGQAPLETETWAGRCAPARAIQGWTAVAAAYGDSLNDRKS